MPLALPKSLRRLSTNVPLSWVLTVPFVLPTIGAVALVGYLSYQSGLATVENMGRQLVAQTNERVTQEVKTYLQTPLLINRLNVDAVNQKQLDLQNVPALESALFNRLQQFDQVSAVLFVSPQGKFRVVERLPKLYLGIADPPQPDKLLIYRLDSQSRRGQLVTTVNGLDVRRDRPWYQRATTTGKLGWNPISQYGTSKALTLDASQPVSDHTTKRLLGVFAVHVRLDYLSEFLHHLDISRFGQVIIMDQSGALVATSTQEQLYTIAAGTGSQSQLKQLNINESHDNFTRSLGKYLHDRPSTLGALEQPQDLEFRYKGELQYLEITPYQDPYGLNWRILTVIPRSHFLEPIQHNTRRTLLLCLLTLGVAIGLGLLAANRLTATFAQLNGASRELAIGNLAQRLPTDSPISELNDLAQTFNQMAEQLQQSFDRIKTALEESKEKFTTIFRTSPHPIAIASLAEGCLMEVNDSLLEFFGYSPAEMIGCTALELNLWSNLNERDRYRALLQQQRRVRNLEVQMRTKSGEVKTILLSAEIRTLEGQDRSIVMHRDISDHKAAELALQQSEARYRAIVENQTELIARFLPDTTLVFVNDAYCRYFGINQEDIIGKSYAPIVYEADRDKVARI
ncbi:MAG: PAS domain S-box protein, partial [Chroococcidiopsidaceae cyanobacterium CP_BM_RX_35]|nr:PAS domain S-box protein [Chroococcidiopsidaceae cyanobacterium CP_BM_RX_35]